MANNKKAFLGVGGKPKFSQPDQQKHIDSVSKNIAILTGQTKNTKDRAVLVRDLMDFGLLDARGRFKSNSGTTIVGGGGNGGGIVNPNPETPTKPVNVRASAAFTTIMVQWDFPNYAGHEHAEIWRNTVDALGDMQDPRTEGEAVLVATVAGSMYMDNVQPETGYYYWVRFVNVNGLAGPVHSASGVYAETLPDIETILNEFQEESLETLQTFQETFNGQIDRLDTQIADFGFEASKLEINQLNSDVLTLTDGLFNHIVTTERNYNDWLADAKALGDRADVTEAKLEQNYYTKSDAESAISAGIEMFRAGYLTETYKTAAEINDAHYTKVDADEAIASAITTLETETLTPNYATFSYLSTNVYTKTSANAAIAAKVAEFKAEIIDDEGNITNAFTNKMGEVLAGPDGAIAQEIAQYGVTYGGNTYTIEEGIQVSVDLNGEYTKQWGVQTEVGNLQHGVGFIDDNGVTTFLVSADNFAVFNPVDGEWEAVFGVRDGRVVITEAIIGNAILETLAVQFKATFEGEVIVNGELDAWKLKGAQITGNALWMVNGNHSLAIEPDDFLAFWYGEAVYYNVETDTDERSIGNAKFALTNDGRVIARGLELYDNNNTLIMSANGMSGTFIRNLTVDTLKIKADAVTVPTYIEGEVVFTDHVWAELLDYSFEEDFPIKAMFNFSVLFYRQGDISGADAVSITMLVYEDGQQIDSIALPNMYAESVGGKNFGHSLPLFGAVSAPSGKIRVRVSAQARVENQMYSFKLQGSITNAKR
ncbi:phage tail tip fiber protein [Alteromonas macleodii]|uniref:phage tail tip fiber protein n=1 Tax=Alteromonas macleodii TaxID=28108 RepID=UPI003CFD442B